MNKIGQRIKEIMAEKGISEEELVDLAEIGTKEIQHIEHGDLLISPKKIRKIAKALNVEISEIIF